MPRLSLSFYSFPGIRHAARIAIFFAMFVMPLVGRSQEYEVDGTINMRIFQPDMASSGDYPGTFTVYVKGSGWLIHIMETNQWGILQQHEIGTTDGKDIFELEQPLGTSQLVPTATATSNTIPVGNLDTSLVGHLWLMFASSSYFRDAPPGKLKPVYNWHATPMMNNQFTLDANWQLLDGPGSLPSQVTYSNRDGSISGIYTANTVTNVGTFRIPGSFHFSQPDTGHKEVSAVVTAVRETCSLSDLRPAIKEKMVIADLRWHAPELVGFQFTSYKADYWPTVEQARKIFYSTRYWRSHAPLNTAP